MGPTESGKCGKHALDKSAVEPSRGAARDDSKANIGGHDEVEDWRSLPPCVPRVSLRITRRLWSLNAGILAGACLLFFMSIPGRETFFVPGELSRKHAQILENTLVSDRCGLCHPTSHAQAISSTGRATQDDLCLRCHTSHPINAELRHAHDLPIERLQALSKRTSERLISTGKRPSVQVDDAPGNRDNSSCSVCHVEHHGREFDLKSMDDARCQACHQQRFASLATDHPEFENFPYHRDRSMQFDHRAHQDRHFPLKSQQFDCRQCHLDRSPSHGAGRIARSLGFDVACAPCHAEPIRASIAGGWAVIQLPSLEDDDASDPKLGLTDWPKNARYGYDGVVSPAMRVLLQADEASQQSLSILPISGKLSEAPPYDRLRATAAIGLAHASRNLVLESASAGQAAWKRRLTIAIGKKLGREASERESQIIDDACAGMPPDLFRQVQSSWFAATGSLANNQLRHRAFSLGLEGSEPALSRFYAPPSVLHSPYTDLADRDPTRYFLVDSENPPQNGTGGAAPRNRSPLRIEAGGRVLPLRDGASSLLQDSRDGSHDDWLSSTKGSNDFDNALRPDAGANKTLSHKLEKVRGAKHVAEGGWYLDRDTLTVNYMPRGHADPFLTAWARVLLILDNPSAVETQTETRPDKPTVDGGLLNQIPGRCVECHNSPGVDIASAPTTGFWQVAPSTTEKKFTKFDHRPHLTLPSLSDCGHCHKLATESARAKLVSVPHAPSATNAQSQREPHSPEFAPMQRDQCAACHRPGGANDGCTQCHNYHIGFSHKR